MKAASSFAAMLPMLLIISCCLVVDVIGHGTEGIRDVYDNLGHGKPFINLHDPAIVIDHRRSLLRPKTQMTPPEQADSMEEEYVQQQQAECTPKDLEEFPQWQAEEGYWIGEYSFYGSDGLPFNSSNWNYRYDAYRGFITGDVEGSSYRQRNVFLYPPQFESECDVRNDAVVGNGTCGVNGNSRIFFADQTAANGTCNGSIEGDFAGIFHTTTDLIGRDNNAILYQVYFSDMIPDVGGALFQSQLTTLTTNAVDGTQLRTRSAQSFSPLGEAGSLSFYRERQVSKEEFYEQLEATLEEYNILESDTCAWMDDFDGSVISSGGEPGLERCMEHLEETFELEG